MATAPTPELFTAAFGQQLAALNLARYSRDEGYGADDPDLPAFFEHQLADAPDTAVALQILAFSQDRDTWNPDVTARLRWRAAGADPNAVGALANAAAAVLHVPDHAYQPQTWPGGVRVLDVRVDLFGRPAQDANGRWMRADTYRFTLNPGV